MGPLLALLLFAGVASSAVDDEQLSRKHPDLPSGITPSAAVGNTHNCANFFPAQSQRHNEEGDVLVGYDVTADGTVTRVHVLKSSGRPRLDLAAVECVSEAWRNTPAHARDGTPVASPGHKAILRFMLSGSHAPQFRGFGWTGVIVLFAVGLVLFLSAGGLAWWLGRSNTRRRAP